MRIYIKERGYENYYEADVQVRKSRRGHFVAHVKPVLRISKYRFYKQDQRYRFIINYQFFDGYENVLRETDIIDIGESHFFEKLNALNALGE